MIYLIILISIIFLLLFSGYKSGISVEKLKLKYTYPESDFFQFEGMNIHYRKTGSGPFIVLIHGVTSSLHTWDYWQKKLSENYTVISLDIPSFGLTGPHPKNDYSVEMYMRMLDVLTYKYKIDNFTIVGNSFGGYLSWNYSLHKPEKINKLVLIDSAGFKDITPMFLMFNAITLPGFNWIVSNITHKIIIKLSLYNVFGNKKMVTDKVVERYYELLLRKGNRKGYTLVLKDLIKRKKLVSQIKRIEQSTLILWGTKDRIIPLKHAYLFNTHIKNSKLEIFEGSGHIAMEENPKESLKILEQFLEN